MSDQPVQSAAPIRLGALLLLTAVFTSVALQWSLDRGRLVFLPQYDDVGYVTQGLRLRDHVYTDGIQGFRKDYKADPAHAPLFRVLSAVGWTVFGLHDWSPYAAGGLLVLLLVYFLDRLMLPAPPWLRWGTIAFALLIPMTAMLCTEFRPDGGNGLLTAIGIVILLGPAYGRRGGGIWGGIFFAAALLMKPTAVPNTVVLFGAATVCGIWAGWMLERPHWTRQRMGLRLVEVIGPGVMLAGWFYVLRFEYLYIYIRDNMFGHSKYIWMRQMPLSHHLLFYLWGKGSGGEFMLGNQVWILLAVMLAGLVVTTICRRRLWVVRAIVFGVMLTGAYAIPTINAVKQEFFGTSFQFLLLLSAAVTVRGLVMETDDARWRRIAPVALGALLVAAIWVTRFPSPWALRGTFPDQRNGAVLNIYADISRIAAGQPTKVVLTTIGYLNPELIDHLAVKDGQRQLKVRTDYGSGKPQEFKELFDKADIVVAAGMDNTDVSGNMPSSLIRDQTLQLVRDRKDFTLLRRVEGPFGPYYVFVRNTRLPATH